MKYALQNIGRIRIGPSTFAYCFFKNYVFIHYFVFHILYSWWFQYFRIYYIQYWISDTSLLTSCNHIELTFFFCGTQNEKVSHWMWN